MIVTLTKSLSTDYMKYDEELNTLDISIPNNQTENFMGSHEMTLTLEDDTGLSNEYFFMIYFLLLQEGTNFEDQDLELTEST